MADFLGLDLLLLKSEDGIMQAGTLLERLSVPVDTDIVDPFFIPFVLEKKVIITIMNRTRPHRVKKFLKGKAVSGTRIGTTF